MNKSIMCRKEIINDFMIIDLLENKKYLKEYFKLCLYEWGQFDPNNLESIVEAKIKKAKNGNIIYAMGLIFGDELVGFISLLKRDGDCRSDLTPWYGTMYVREDYRGCGLSKLLNEEILKKAKKMYYSCVYLKTDLINYYEKFGASFIEVLDNGESLYKIELE